VLQILLGAELDQAPIGKLAVQRLAEAFAIFEARSLAGGHGMRGAVEIDQGERAGAATEMFHFELQPAGAFEAHGGNAPRQIALVIPALNRHRRRALCDRKRAGSNGHRIVAGFDEDGLVAGFEKALNRQGRLARTTARGLPGCRIQRFYYGSFYFACVPNTCFCRGTLRTRLACARRCAEAITADEPGEAS
jgi:hypothetical protein